MISPFIIGLVKHQGTLQVTNVFIYSDAWHLSKHKTNKTFKFWSVNYTERKKKRFYKNIPALWLNGVFGFVPTVLKAPAGLRPANIFHRMCSHIRSIGGDLAAGMPPGLSYLESCRWLFREQGTSPIKASPLPSGCFADSRESSRKLCFAVRGRLRSHALAEN